jgi:hypothetical protein
MEGSSCLLGCGPLAKWNATEVGSLQLAGIRLLMGRGSTSRPFGAVVQYSDAVRAECAQWRTAGDDAGSAQRLVIRGFVHELDWLKETGRLRMVLNRDPHTLDARQFFVRRQPPLSEYAPFT